MEKEVSPNIEIFNNQVRELGIEPNDPRINERALFQAYSEGRKPTLDKILKSDQDADFDVDGMEAVFEIS